MEPLRFAMIGYGGFAYYMCENYFTKLPTLKLVAVQGPKLEKAQSLGAQYGVPAFESLDNLFEKSDAEAVFIASPNDTHHPITARCAEAGLHVFCEKAMATTVDECYDMIEVCERYGVKLTVGHKRRLRTQYARMGEIIHSGELGAPMAANITGYHWCEWAGFWQRRDAVGGLFHASGVHDIDDLRFFFGDVDTVYAVASPKFDANTDYDDVMALTLRFKSGAVASLQVSCRYPLLPFRGAFEYQILCERGGILYDPQTLTLHYQKVGGERQSIQYPDHGHDRAFRLELNSFVEWVREGTPPVLTAEGGLRCVEVMQAAYISAGCGEPVALPLPRGLGKTAQEALRAALGARARR